MPIVRDGWREPSGKTIYRPTDKDLPSYKSLGGKEEAYWTFARGIESTLGPEGGTVMEVYQKVGWPIYGLTSGETSYMLKAAKKEGYIQ